MSIAGTVRDFDARYDGDNPLGPPASKPTRVPTTNAGERVANGRPATVAASTVAAPTPVPPTVHRPTTNSTAVPVGGRYYDEDWDDCWTWVKYPPLVPEYAAFCFIMNMIIPGTGTLIATLSIFCCAQTDHWTTGQKVCATLYGLVVGLLQMATAIIVIGWVWSCIWGSKIFLRASKRQSGDDFKTGPTTAVSKQGRVEHDDVVPRTVSAADPRTFSAAAHVEKGYQSRQNMQNDSIYPVIVRNGRFGPAPGMTTITELR